LPRLRGKLNTISSQLLQNVLAIGVAPQPIRLAMEFVFMNRQLFDQPAPTPEEANRRNFLAITSGNIWYRTGEVARIEKGDVVSLVTNQKIANLDESGSLRSLDGQPLYIQLEIVNGGGRIPAGTNHDAIERFMKLVRGSEN
jgi:hypothetical protein